MSVATPFPLPVRSADSDTKSGAETGSSSQLRNGLCRNAPVAMAQCNDRGVITETNLSFDRLLDLAPVSVPPVVLCDLVQAQYREQMERLLQDLFADRRGSFQIENTVRTAGAPEDACWVRWTVWRAASSPGNFAYGVLAEDVTRERRSARRAAQAGRMEALGRLASGVAHDFNNLLTGVILYSDLLLAGLETEPWHSDVIGSGLGIAGADTKSRLFDDGRSTDRLRNYVAEIRTAGVHASGLVRQLLAIARAPDETPRLLSLNRLAEGMRKMLQRLIGENIELVYELDPNLGAVRMEATHAQQILLNLVLNARDAMPKGGRITVETRNCGLQIVSGADSEREVPVELPCALFVVRDNGQGMDSETKQRVFEAFFSTKPEGTGLGLSTVCDIVSQSGGLIHLNSARRLGTRVTIVLPLVPAQAVSPDANPETNSASQISLCTIPPAEFPEISPGDSKPQYREGALPFPEEELTP